MAEVRCVLAGKLAGTPGTVAVKVVDAARFRNIRDVDQMRNELAVMQARPTQPEVNLLSQPTAPGGPCRTWCGQAGFAVPFLALLISGLLPGHPRMTYACE